MTYTTTLTRHPEATLWIHVVGEAAHEAEPEDLEAFGLVHRSEVTPPRTGGPYCMHCGGQHLGVECRMRAAEVERDAALDRSRRAAQTLIAEFGADGPLNVDEAAERAVRVARERADGLAQAVTDATAEVVERVCAAVRWEPWAIQLGTAIGQICIGDVLVGPGEAPVCADRIRDEIRKAAKG